MRNRAYWNLILMMLLLMMGCTGGFMPVQDCDFGSGVITGQVLDSETTQPIANVSITIESAHLGSCGDDDGIQPITAMTDHEGRFTVSALMRQDQFVNVTASKDSCATVRLENLYPTINVASESWHPPYEPVSYLISMECE